MKSMTLPRVLGVLAATALSLAAPAVHAIQFTISHAEAAGLGAGPFGTVDVTQNGANVDILVTLNAPYNFVKTGALGSQQFAFNGVGVALADITVDAHNPALSVTPAPFNGAFTGTWGFGITAPSLGNGAPGFHDPISIHIANATVADLTAANNNGYIFAVDLIVSATGSTGPAVVTGGPGPGTGVPDGGSTVALLGLALGALALIRRKLS